MNGQGLGYQCVRLFYIGGAIGLSIWALWVTYGIVTYGRFILIEPNSVVLYLELFVFAFLIVWGALIGFYEVLHIGQTTRISQASVAPSTSSAGVVAVQGSTGSTKSRVPTE